MSLEAINVLLFVLGPIGVIAAVGKAAHWFVHNGGAERAAAVARTGRVLVGAAEAEAARREREQVRR